jgi:hypothetical protein
MMQVLLDRRQGMESKLTRKGKKTLITLSVDEEASQRILDAFKKGEFAKFGVIEIKEQDTRWADGETEKRQRLADDSTDRNK